GLGFFTFADERLETARAISFFHYTDVTKDRSKTRFIRAEVDNGLSLKRRAVFTVWTPEPHARLREADGRRYAGHILKPRRLCRVIHQHNRLGDVAFLEMLAELRGELAN